MAGITDPEAEHQLAKWAEQESNLEELISAYHLFVSRDDPKAWYAGSQILKQIGRHPKGSAEAIDLLVNVIKRNYRAPSKSRTFFSKSSMYLLQAAEQALDKQRGKQPLLAQQGKEEVKLWKAKRQEEEREYEQQQQRRQRITDINLAAPTLGISELERTGMSFEKLEALVEHLQAKTAAFRLMMRAVELGIPEQVYLGLELPELAQFIQEIESDLSDLEKEEALEAMLLAEARHSGMSLEHLRKCQSAGLEKLGIDALLEHGLTHFMPGDRVVCIDENRTDYLQVGIVENAFHGAWIRVKFDRQNTSFVLANKKLRLSGLRSEF